MGRCLFWNFHSRQSGDAAEAFDNANVTWAKNRQGSRAKVEEWSVGGGRQVAGDGCACARHAMQVP